MLTLVVCRVNSTSAATARSSASKMANPNPSSSSARTPAASPGPSCTAASTRRVSQRYGFPVDFLAKHIPIPSQTHRTIRLAIR